MPGIATRVSLMATLLIVQAGGPTPVINASLAGILDAAAASPRFDRILGGRHTFEGVLDGRFTRLDTLSADARRLLADTPGAALHSSRRRLTDADLDRLPVVLQANDISAAIIIGGNGSMWLAHALHARVGHAIQIVGVPKTIDNDLAGVDHAPGYGSAARFIAQSVRDTGLDLETMATFDDVTILEVMGRNSGWLAAAGALARDAVDDERAPHLVYVPEQPFDEAEFLADVRQVHRRLGIVYVVVSEGIRHADGEFVGAATGGPTDPLGRQVHSLSLGPGNHLAGLIGRSLNLQARCLRPGLIGRTAAPSVSPVDRSEAARLGRAAFGQLLAGAGGVMVTLERQPGTAYAVADAVVPLADVAGRERLLPPDYFDAARRRPTPAFHAYAQPLIGGPLPPVFRLNR